MTNSLIPVKRPDRNGKLVTRHVKPDTGASKVMSVPAPSLSISGNNPALADGWRLVPRQTVAKKRDESGVAAAHGEEPVFIASDVEMYTILSVASPDAALELLAGGVRSAEHAVEFLTAEGRESELVDGVGMAREMLARRVPAEFFVMGFQRLSAEQVEGASSELLADYSEFFAIRSIMRKDSPKIADEVLRGEIRLADVRAVGIDHLKTGDRLEIARPALKALAAGSEKFTTEDLSGLLQKRLFGGELVSAVEYMIQCGGESSRLLKGLGVGGFWGMKLDEMADRLYPDVEIPREEAFAVIDYSARMVDASGMDLDLCSKEDVTEVLRKGQFLHESGVDVQFAAERIREDDVQAIIAMSKGVHRAVSDGWL
jgi:hypothetical protein